MSEWLFLTSVWVTPLVLAITLHEAAHGFAAKLFGDRTAADLGRVTLNPLRHIDPLGTLIIPGMLLITQAPFLFGWAKPVPVDFSRLKPQRFGIVTVAAAGPLTNFALAIGAVAALYGLDFLPAPWVEGAARNLLNALQINLVLAVFNLLPLPPLDGGRIAVCLLPRILAYPLARLERVGMLILIGALALLPLIGGQLGLDLNIFPWLVGEPVRWLSHAILTMMGIV